MSTTTTSPFDSTTRSGIGLSLSLRRRGRSAAPLPMESADTMETGSSTPFESETPGHLGHAALQAAWDKLYRARSILEAEQAHLRDDRIALQGEVEVIVAREQAVAARELRIQQIEMQLALDLEEKKDEEESRSALNKLTHAPFDIARSMFGPKK